MTKNDMRTILAALNGENVDTTEIKAKLTAELVKNAEEKAEKEEAYEAAKEAVLEALTVAGTNVTVAELYEECKDKLPHGFTKAQVQYGLIHYWTAEIEKIEGKPNTYKVRA